MLWGLVIFLHWHFLETHLCTVHCTYTLKRSTKTYCTVFLLLFVLLAKGIAHNDHSLSFYMFIMKSFGAKRNNHDSEVAQLDHIMSTEQFLQAKRAISQPGSWTACEKSWMFFRSHLNEAGSITGWLTQWLEVQARQRLAAGGVIKWERWLAEDWYVTLHGDAMKVFHCQSGNVTAKEKHSVTEQGETHTYNKQNF